jgi:kynurenine formamidase
MALLIDCSHTIEDGMVTYPGLPGPRIGTHLSRVASRDHYSPGTEFHIGTIEMVANTGTYLDTPFHRFEDGYDLADLDLSRVADLPGVCIRSDQQAIPPNLLAGINLEGRAVLFCTGWARHWGTDHYGEPSHPFLADATAEALIGGGAALVGIDSVNIDDTRTGARTVHTALLQAGIPIVEHLTGLDRLVGEEFRFFAVPPKVREFGTFPVRAFALVG